MDEIVQKLVRLNEIEALKRPGDDPLQIEWVRTRDELNKLLKPYHLEVLYNAIWSRYCIG